MNFEQFSKTIKKLRIKNNLTQKEFADKLGVTYQAVSKWENGKNMPDILLLKNISNMFDVDINLLLGEKKKKADISIKICIVGLILLLIIASAFVIIISKNSSNFYFKTITSDCDEFTITGSAAYNDKKSAIYISDVNYCGKENNVIYKKINCSLYEEYRNTKTMIGSCGETLEEQTLEEFVETVQINVNNYVASCKMFASSILYMEIQAFDKDEKITTYQIPINLDDNCKR